MIHYPKLCVRRAYRFRGQARGYALEAVSDMNESVRLAPYDWYAYDQRASFWRKKDPDRYAADKSRRQRTSRCDGQLQSRLVMVITSNPTPQTGQDALKLATDACKTTDYSSPGYLGCLAACYAMTGDFEQAKKWANKAIELAPESEKGTWRITFAKLRSGQDVLLVRAERAKPHFGST